MNNPPLRMALVSPLGRGGLTVLWFEGEEEDFRRWDARFASSRKGNNWSLCYGRLRDTKGEVIDEVLWARPTLGRRILTGHGGVASALALLDFFREEGITEVEPHEMSFFWTSSSEGERSAPPISTSRFWIEREKEIVANVDRRLPTAKTPTQAAILLATRRELGTRLQEIARLQGEARRVALTELHQDCASARRFFSLRRIVLAGAPNVGKSSFLNRFVLEDRALVSPIAGTTRDAVEVEIDLGGYWVRMTDTAGWHGVEDRATHLLEAQATQRAIEAYRTADIILWMVDGSRPLTSIDHAVGACLQKIHSSSPCRPSLILLINKSDLPQRLPKEEIASFFPHAPCCTISCLQGDPRSLVEPLLIETLGGTWNGRPLPLSEAWCDLDFF